MMNFNDFGQFQMNNEQTENATGGIRFINSDYANNYYNDSTPRICGTLPPPLPEQPTIKPIVELVVKPKIKLNTTSVLNVNSFAG